MCHRKHFSFKLTWRHVIGLRTSLSWDFSPALQRSAALCLFVFVSLFVCWRHAAEEEHSAQTLNQDRTRPGESIRPARTRSQVSVLVNPWNSSIRNQFLDNYSLITVITSKLRGVRSSSCSGTVSAVWANPLPLPVLPAWASSPGVSAWSPGCWRRWTAADTPVCSGSARTTASSRSPGNTPRATRPCQTRRTPSSRSG